MKDKTKFMALAMTAFLLVSCSNDAEMLPGSETGSISFDVSIDTALGSRAGESGDEVPSRCLLEVYEGTTDNKVGEQQSVNGSSSFTFTVPNLEKGKKYTFVFWADGGESTFDTSSLTAITSKTDNHIAFSGKVMSEPGVGNVSVILGHAVAKLSVVHNDAEMNLSSGDIVSAKFTRQKYSFNAVTGAYTRTTSVQESFTETITADKTNGEIVSRYMLAPNDEMKENSNPSMMVTDFRLAYRGTSAVAEYEKSIPNVTFKANHRTVITGNIKNLSLDSQSFSITLNTGWGTIAPENGGGTEPDKPVVPDNPDNPDTPVIPGSPTITLSEAGTLTNDAIANALGTGKDLAIRGPMNDADFGTIKTYLTDNPSKEINLDLSGAEVTEIPEDAFNSCSNLTDITLSSSIETIGVYAFYRTGITEVTAIGAKTVEEGAFRECANLTKATLGDLKSADNSVFFGCPAMTELDLSRCTSAIGYTGSFFTSQQTITIYVSSGLIGEFKTKWANSSYNITWVAK